MNLKKISALLLLASIVGNSNILSASAVTLYEANQSTGDRTYTITDGTEYIGQSLGRTGTGVFNVSGNSTNSILSGYINGSLTSQGSFFKLTSTNNTVLNLSNLTIQDAQSIGSGGSVIVLQNGNSANLNNVIVRNNSASTSGGAIYSNNSNLTITNSIFDGNKATSTAGAIIVYGTTGKTVIDNTIFENNSAANTGAMYITSSDLTLTNSVFRNNQSNSTASGSNPGALRLGTGDAVSIIDNCLFDSNISGNNAGALYSYGDTTISNTGFTNNYANFRGGAIIVANNSNTKITGSYITNNTSQEFAGAIYNDGNLTVDNTLIEGNQALTHNPSGADGRGGAIYNTGIVNLNEGTLVRNNHSAGEGGAIANATRGLININGAVFDSNVSDTDGGAIWNLGTGTIGGNTAFVGNSTSGQGGAILNRGRMDLTSDANGDIVFQNNTSSAGANDIHNLNELNVNGDTGNVVVNGGITGTGVVNKYNNGNLILHGDSSNYTGDFNQSGGTTAISDGKWFGGTSSIQGGNLEWGTGAQKTDGVIHLTNSSLYVHPDAVLDLNNSADRIESDAVVYLDNNATINNQGTITFNKDDTWLGKVNNTNNITLDNITVDSGSISHTDGELYMYNNASLTLNPDSQIRGGNMTINSGSVLNIPDNYFLVNNLNMDGGTINVLNNQTSANYISNNFAVGSGGANFSIDFDGDRKIADQFVAGNFIGTGTISVDHYNVLGAPTDERIPFPVFAGNNVENINFSATNDIVNTPIYQYNLLSEGAGVYSLNRGGFNPSVNRGAETAEAMFINNIIVTNIIFEHVYIDSEKLNKLGGRNNSNIYYSPFQQVDNEEGSIWYKPYISYDRFSLTNNNMIYNTAYGSILGFDFPTQKINDEWEFLPTAFITYQGAAQSANGNRYYQNGGMGGFMGTVFHGDWISSVLAYGGGYNNEMSGEGYNENTGNWYAGCAAISAYNFHPKKNIIIQPILWTGYNIIGKQNWHSDYGNLNMATGYLNGLVVSPGLNAFYGADTWSIYGTINYLFTINDQVSAYAGDTQLDMAKLNYGFLQYGVGFIKSFKDRLLAYGQVTLRNGGLTGIAFWGGLSYMF